MARKTVFGLVFVALIAVTAVLINRAQQDYSWENPITRLDAKIDSRWKHSTELVDGGVQAHLFTEPTDRAMVSLLMENGPGYTLHDYVLGVKMGFAARGLFVDDGRFSERDGRQTWEGSGSMVQKNASIRINAQVVQIGSVFWQVRTIQNSPYDQSDALVAQLRAALWSTVK